MCESGGGGPVPGPELSGGTLTPHSQAAAVAGWRLGPQLSSWWLLWAEFGNPKFVC